MEIFPLFVSLHFRKTSSNSQYEQEDWLQQGKPVSLFIWAPACTRPLMLQNGIYSHQLVSKWQKLEHFRSENNPATDCTHHACSIGTIPVDFLMWIWCNTSCSCHFYAAAFRPLIQGFRHYSTDLAHDVDLLPIMRRTNCSAWADNLIPVTNGVECSSIRRGYAVALWEV